MSRFVFALLFCACETQLTLPATDMAMGPACALAANTTATSTVTRSCTLLQRDASGCSAARAGLSGFWLKFSCRVTLTKNADTISVQTDSQPDYTSNYFAATNACYSAAAGGTITNPNRIAATNMTLVIPTTPSGSEQAMMGAVVGVALNGVPIFSNFAAPGDDIFQEAMTFDACQGHPQMAGLYHYHSEPYSISYDDSNFIGVMRDGHPLYGRRDSDGSLPTLDAAGGHVGTTPDSTATAVYHYHVNLQTSIDPRTSGQMQWFLTTGRYHAAPGTCTGC